MKNYFSNKMFYFSGLVVSIVALGFILSVSDEPNPKRVVFNSVFNKPIEKTSVLFSDSYIQAKDKLQKAGIQVEDGKSIRELAKLNKTSPFRIITILSKEQ